jgi:hypothetical protein
MNPTPKKGRYTRLVERLKGLRETWDDRFNDAVKKGNFMSAGIAECRSHQISECLEIIEQVYIKGIK